LNFSPPWSGRHFARATPSLRDDQTTAITTGGGSTYPAPIPVQTNPATSVYPMPPDYPCEDERATITETPFGYLLEGIDWLCFRGLATEGGGAM